MQIHLLVANLPISVQKLKEFQEATKADLTLQTIAQLTKQGWPDHKHKILADARPYWSFKEKIYDTDKILIKNQKMTVPEQLRPEMLKRIHVKNIHTKFFPRVHFTSIALEKTINLQTSEVNSTSLHKHNHD